MDSLKKMLGMSSDAAQTPMDDMNGMDEMNTPSSDMGQDAMETPAMGDEMGGGMTEETPEEAPMDDDTNQSSGM